MTVATASGSIRVGDAIDLTARAQFSDESARDVTTEATWESSNPSVQAVTSPGKGTGVAAGQVELRATYQGVADRVSVAVAPGPRS